MYMERGAEAREPAAEHTDLAEKMLSILDDIISKIQAAFEGVTAGYKESELLQDMEDIQQKWDAAFREAVKQRNFEVGSVQQNEEATAIEQVEELLTAPEITANQARKNCSVRPAERNLHAADGNLSGRTEQQQSHQCGDELSGWGAVFKRGIRRNPASERPNQSASD